MSRSGRQRTAVLPPRPDRLPASGLWMALTLTLAVLSLLSFGTILLALPPEEGFVPFPLALAALHLYTLGFLVPVLLTAVSLLSASLFLQDVPRLDPGILFLPVVWLGGVGVALGFVLFLGFLPWAGTLLTVASLTVAGSAAFRIRAGLAPTRELGLGIGLGLVGLLATLVVGVVMALGYTGAEPWPPPLLLHLALAAGAAFVPMLMAVSQQVFPMFAHCPPAPRPLHRMGPALWEATGTALLVLGVLTGRAVLRDVGAIAIALALAVWLIIQERMYAHRHGKTHDPAAWGARIGALSLVLGAWLSTAGLLGTVSGGRVAGSGSWVGAGIALVLLGGIGGSVVAYVRRILPFVIWNLLFRRFGRADFLPKLDRLRPRLPVEILPVAWALGSAVVAFSMGAVHPQAIWERWGDAHNTWLLAAAIWLAGIELLWSVLKGGRIWAAHRREAHRGGTL